MKIIIFTSLLLISLNTFSYEKRPASIQWKSPDVACKLIIPKEHYEMSQFGKGKYRIDNFQISRGHFNNIYIIFQNTKNLEHEPIAPVQKKEFLLNKQPYLWRTYKTIIEGKEVTRRETILPNILPHDTEKSESNFIWIRMDVYKENYLDILTPVAEQIISDALPNKCQQQDS